MNIKKVQVYPDDITSAKVAPNVAHDHPINLVDPSLMADPSLLPAIRFLFHEKDLFELTF
jgi:hypothetical protein